MSTAPEFDLASLLDGTLDDLADRPEFKPFSPGTHEIDLSMAVDEKLPHVYFASGTLRETLELADPNETPMEAGTDFRVRLDLSNKYGQADMKMILDAAKSVFGEKSNRELIAELATPMSCTVVTSNRTNKDKTYTSIVACVAG